jgi:hypothetical protein
MRSSWAVRMMTNELNVNKETIPQSSMKIYRRRRSAQSSSHTDSRMSRSNGDSYHAKTSFRLVKIILFFLLHFLFPNMKTALKAKRFQDVENIKINVTAELKAVALEAFVDCFQELFKPFYTCNQVDGDYFDYT